MPLARSRFGHTSGDAGTDDRVAGVGEEALIRA
jgi:hypothetical protein